MEHLPKLIEDLALILLVGAVVTLLFKWIRQPLVLGYIIAGFCVGPHLLLIPTVVDTENVKTLAHIGIIFLLFSLGLEFNFKKLMHIGTRASVTALVEIVFITLTGFILGKLMGWSTIDSIFLGGMLASSSTTIIMKAFDDLGMKNKQYTHVVFGILIVEDIVVILLLVLLPTIALAQNFAGAELLLTVLKLLFFLIIMVVAGIFLLPNFLKKARKLINDETLLILSVGLCLGMVVLATRVGFSAELGAFIMGFILAESTSAQKVEHVIKPVKDLFAAVFFVSIGMMIDPAIIMKYGWAVVAVTLLTILGKLISTIAGALLSGQSLKQSVQVGTSMAQIGEFAFIVATLGLSLGVISNFLFPVAVGASAITTFTTPYMIKYSEKFFMLLVKVLPEKWLTSLHNYSLRTKSIQKEREWKAIVKSYVTLIFTNGIILVTLVLISIKFFIPFLQGVFKSSIISNLIGLTVTLIIISPFLWGVIVKRPNDNANYSHSPFLVMEILRIFIGLFFIVFFVDRLFSAWVALLVIVPLILIALIVFSTHISNFYKRLEKRFLFNLYSNNEEDKPEEATTKMQEQLTSYLDSSPWDVHIIELEVASYAACVGKTLEELSWREKYGINIAYIKRGDELIYAPTRTSKLFPFDKVGIIATDEQMEIFHSEFETSDEISYIEDSIDDIIIQNIQVDEHSKLHGLSIKESGVREITNGLIIGIERNNERILNPVSSTIFELGDIVWIAGKKNKVQKLYRL